MEKRKLKDACTLAAFIWVLFGLLLYVVSYYTGNLVSSEHAEEAQITNFSVCYGPDPNTGKLIYPNGGYISGISGEAKIYACGHLETKYPLPIQFHWYDEGFPETPGTVYSSSGEVRFATGYFYDELKLDEPLAPGKYRLLAAVGRTRMASLAFEVSE
ncbi:MAG: hypothetical protein GY796_08040 [Chloroflexi bacterium]|nr:hypothetical protein [Chloroflexota bacterium]